MSYKDFFKGKKVAVVGCGQDGAMLADIRFLAAPTTGAKVSLYEVRSAKRLGDVAKALKAIEDGVMCHFGVGLGLVAGTSVDRVGEELASADLIILAPDVSRNTRFLKRAIDAKVQIEYPDTIFFKLTPPITLIGVMGRVAKTSVSAMIYDMLSRATESEAPLLIDSEKTGALHMLKKIKKDDIAVVRIPEQLVGEYVHARITPHIAVVTHVSTIGKNSDGSDEDLLDLLKLQTFNSFLVAGNDTITSLKKSGTGAGGNAIKAKIMRARPESLPVKTEMSTHARDNAALSVEVALILKVGSEAIKSSLSETRPLKSAMKGRLELLRVRGRGLSNIYFYNDTASVRPEAALAALRALSADPVSGKNIILIFGGAYTGASCRELFENIPQYVSCLIVLPGSATLVERARLVELQNTPGLQVVHVPDINHAVRVARDIAGKGDRILFSPACEAIGVHNSRIDRGNDFVKAVRELK